MNVPCPIHGSKRAHRGCHHCRRPICKLCELKMRGHLYCSPRCARNAGRDDLKMKVRESLGRPVSARLAVVIVLLACSAPGVLALRTVAELERLNSSSSLPPRRAPLHAPDYRTTLRSRAVPEKRGRIASRPSKERP